MDLLIIGSGGREHALAWTLAASPGVGRLYVAPGNAGTATLPRCENVPLGSDDLDGLLDFARRRAIGLTVVGPEAPLVAGIVDRFEEAGLPIFGPRRAAARLEGSKAFAKRFMAEQGIPTATATLCRDYEQARAAVRAAPALPVLKLSGLAAGKGVFLPETLPEAEAILRALFLEERFGPAPELVIEERLYGPELSLLALCDGSRFLLLPAAQDHKRLLDGDRGPNTGGMGAFAPTPLATPELIEGVARTVFAPTLEGMAARGTPYRGVLYAGLILTERGPKVLEFNCRFGDPETQVLLPLLASELLPLLSACAGGSLATVEARWHDGAAATVVMAAPGYPERYPTGAPIHGLAAAAALPDVLLFHAGTARRDDGTVVTAGGRVLAVTGIGADRRAALARAYAGAAALHFEGAHYRRDIGAAAG